MGIYVSFVGQVDEGRASDVSRNWGWKRRGRAFEGVEEKRRGKWVDYMITETTTTAEQQLERMQVGDAHMDRSPGEKRGKKRRDLR